MLRLDDFKNKKALIMGLGLHGGGVGSAVFFARLGSRVIVTDLKTKKELASSIAKLRRWKNIQYHLGGHRPEDFKIADYVIKGPGVPENSKYLKIAKRAGVKILSDIEIFFLACPAPIIGITGTKGKTTAASLLFELLGARIERGSAAARYARPSRIRHGSHVWLAGNIRKSVLEILPKIKKSDLVILELSSFQLDSLKNQRVSPHIALITNIFPDHLNRYASMRAYMASKANIFKYQKGKDCLFINSRDKLLKNMARKSSARLMSFDSAKIARRFRKYLQSEIPAYHLPNIASAIAIAKHMGVGDEAIQTVLKNFRGVPHRMEIARIIRGVTFINDTTATNPTAAEYAVISTKKRIGQHSLHVICGGYDKGLPIKNFIRALRRYATTLIFLPGEASEKMKSETPKRASPPGFSRNQKPEVNSPPEADPPSAEKSKIPEVVDARSMAEAVRIAYRNAGRGDVVLLSPGAASFGLFKHEFDRGEQFVRAVKKLAP